MIPCLATLVLVCLLTTIVYITSLYNITVRLTKLHHLPSTSCPAVHTINRPQLKLIIGCHFNLGPSEQNGETSAD